ncbi:hypothetical protein [Aureimonas leprariae]|uniref:hypothetical protein n=1 Tax=Plantimonas leprariae TaxID=2615207 RepID=UPI00192A4B70|nr:hypothetical protein [Aureimonas leprariae]
MTDDRPPKPDKRRERLEAQLRENLKRRKEQARARREPPQDDAADDAPPGETADG